MIAALLRAVWSDDAGGSLAEYALTAALLGIAMITAVGVMQTNVAAMLAGTATGWQNMAQTPP